MTRFEPSPEQGAILDHRDRALRISAGAGTGKTTTIVQRLVRAVAAGADPARALGITFTNKAADELRERLRSSIPARDDGREVEVATYHGFAASILDEHGARHGWTTGFTVMDEGHRFELAGRILHSLDQTDLDLTKIPTLRKDVLAVADALNENLIDADDVRALAPGNGTDDVWRTRLALLDAAERYHTAKADLGLIEYSDLIRRATTLVESESHVADALRSRYDIVLLDEYQDTDRAQRRLLTAIFTDGPEVTAVGDADQTIYEWRGASLRNFEAFPVDFRLDDSTPAPTLPLSINRRSDRLIIDVANRVRSRLPTIEGAEDLRPRPDADAGDVIASWHRTELDEARWVADQIELRHAEGVPHADMAVLCRRRDSLRTIAETFRSAEIPFTVSSMSDLLEVPEIADLHAWLRVLARPDDERALLRILLGGRYRLGMADVAAIRRSVPRKSPLGLMGVIVDGGTIEGLDAASSDAIRSFGETYEGLLVDAQASTLSSTVARVVDTIGLWREVAALPPAASVTARLNLSRFIDLADQWRPLSGFGDLTSFLRYLDALAEPGRAEELDAAEPPTEDAVLLTTAHGAKGLEWSDVYLADVAHGVFPAGVRDYHEPLSKAAALPYAVRLDAEDMADVMALPDAASRKAVLKSRHTDQEWRLAYVAVTRAKHRLSVSGHAWHADNTRRRRPGDLLELVRSTDGVTVGPTVTEDVPRPEPRIHRPLAVAPDPLFPDTSSDDPSRGDGLPERGFAGDGAEPVAGWDAALRATISDPTWPTTHAPDLASEIEEERRQLELRLDGLTSASSLPPPDQPFVTSVTNLVALAECPLKFRWIHHDRLPRRPRASARRGTEFHRRAELHNLGVLSLTPPDEAHYDASGDTEGDPPVPGVDPWEVFRASRFADSPPALVETPFVITLDGRSLRGKVDAIYRDDGHWEIVDYKSGAASPTAAKQVQLEAYATAAALGAFGERPDDIEVTFAWFGEDPATEHTERADRAWLANAHDHVSSLLEQAEEGPFDARPSDACRWCDFLHHCEAGRTWLSIER